MERSLGSIVGVSKPTEMLFLTVLALWFNVFDMTLFELGSNIDQVWKAPMEDEKFSAQAQYYIKILLSGVVFVRTFTLHVYIAFLIAMCWPIYLGTRPALMLPWLLVSAVKNIGTGLVTVATGTYTCLVYGPLRPACLRFLGSQFIDLTPALYMWFLGLSIFRDLSQPPPVNKALVKLSEEEELNQALRRRKVKSILGEEIIRQQVESDKTPNEEEVQDIFIPELSAKITRSLDSLLDVMNAEAEIMEMEEVVEMAGLKMKEHTQKLLGITDSEISRIKHNKEKIIDSSFPPVRPQRKEYQLSLIVSNSPAKLLPNTNLYNPPNPVRPTKSELKTPKDFLRLKVPSDFIQPAPNSVPQFKKSPSNTEIVEKEVDSCLLNNKSSSEKSISTENDSSANFYSEFDSGDDEANYTDCQNDLPMDSPPKIDPVEFSCQVSTLSKKILEAPAKEMTEKLKTKRTRTISIRPPSKNNLKRQNQPVKNSPTASIKSRPMSRKSDREARPTSKHSTRENSYLGIHLHKLELEKAFENTKLGVDKFGITQDVKENVPNDISPSKIESPKKFENISLKL